MEILALILIFLSILGLLHQAATWLGDNWL